MPRLRDFKNPDQSLRPLVRLFEADHWREMRASKLNAARSCRDTLTNPDGFWRYSEDDERVKKAVRFWVARARNCHELAMGRRPVHQVAVIGGGGMVEGTLFASEREGA
jgi:hypothetical protein